MAKTTGKNTLKRITAAALVAGCLLTAGCDAFWIAGVTEQPEPSGAPQGALVPINPNPSTGREQASVTLYYRYRDETILAPDARVIGVPSGERIETAAIQELLKGPAADRTEMKAVFPKGARVISVTDSQDTLFVTLSKEVLDLADDVPENWQEQPAWREAVNNRRKLALYAIVNTVTGMGLYSRVQLLIDMGDGQGERVRRSQVGFAGEPGDSQLLEPLGLKADMILTPKNTLQQAMRAAEAKDWERLYNYLSTHADDNAKNYTLGEFVNWGAGWNGSLSFYQVHDELVAGDGRSALVVLDMRVTLKDGSTAEKLGMPMRLVQENGLWKVYYPSMLALFS